MKHISPQDPHEQRYEMFRRNVSRPDAVVEVTEENLGHAHRYIRELKGIIANIVVAGEEDWSVAQ